MQYHNISCIFSECTSPAKENHPSQPHHPSQDTYHYRWTINRIESYINSKTECSLKSTFATPNNLMWQLTLFFPASGQEDHVKYSFALKSRLSLSTKRSFTHHAEDKFNKLIPVSGNVIISVIDEYNKKVSSSHKQMVWRCMRDFEIEPLYPLISIQELRENKAQLYPKNELTVICQLLYTTNDALVLDIQSTFIADFEKLSNENLFHDVTIVINNGKSFPAHKCILAARSSVFKAMLMSGMKESQTNRIDLVDIEEDVFEELLRYINAARLPNLEKYATELLVAADKYDLQELKTVCEKNLSERLKVEDMIEVLLLADTYSANYLKAEVIKFIKLRIYKRLPVMSNDTLNMLSKSYSHLLSEIFSDFIHAKEKNSVVLKI